MACKGGRVNLFGGLNPRISNITINSNIIHYGEVSLQGTHSSLPLDHEAALGMLARRDIDLSDLITHAFPLEHIQEAFHFAESRQGMHVAVKP